MALEDFDHLNKFLENLNIHSAEAIVYEQNQSSFIYRWKTYFASLFFKTYSADFAFLVCFNQ